MELKLIALDEEDLSVISAHLQDAVLHVSDMAYIPHERRFALVANRFDWATADTRSTRTRSPFVRCQTALRFERVTAAQILGIDLSSGSTVLSLLAIAFEPAELPAGRILLHFAGGGAVRLDVECIEGELRDLGAVWAASSTPDHSAADSADNGDKS